MSISTPPDSPGSTCPDLPRDPWAAFDALFALEVEQAASGVGPLAFYGRCSTEDQQDPETSRDWQLRAAEQLVAPFGGRIVARYFDIGQSRSLPWKRRTEASALLADIADPRRQWTGIVVGEGQRCFYGSQFSEVAPLLEHHGITLHVPELGGAYDPKNSSHYTLMTVTGGMSRGERQRVQERVRLGMSAQVENQGRYQGGRPPYGYVAVGIGPHKNPRKAAEGFQQKQLQPDPDTADVVRRIFAEYIAGVGLREIARGLNADRIPCPAAHRPAQNRHRAGDGWQISTISTIIANPRYTGYEFWGKSRRVEQLVNPEDVTLGYKTAFKRSEATPGTVAGIRSRNPAHEALVSVEDFMAAQQIRTRNARASRADQGRKEKSRVQVKKVRPMRGLVRCAACNRKMETYSPHGNDLYFRCRSRDLTPGSAVAEMHPNSVHIRADVFTSLIHPWLAEIFSQDRRAETIAAMLGSQQLSLASQNAQTRNDRRLSDARVRLTRLQAAIEAGHDPIDLLEPMKRVRAEITGIESEIELTGRRISDAPETLDETALAKMLNELGDLAVEVFDEAESESLYDFYRAINLTVVYDFTEPSFEASWTLALDRGFDAPISDADESRRGSVRVRGGT